LKLSADTHSVLNAAVKMAVCSRGRGIRTKRRERDATGIEGLEIWRDCN